MKLSPLEIKLPHSILSVERIALHDSIFSQSMLLLLLHEHFLPLIFSFVSFSELVPLTVSLVHSQSFKNTGEISSQLFCFIACKRRRMYAPIYFRIHLIEKLVHFAI